MEPLPNRTEIYTKYQEITKVETERMGLQMKVNDLTRKIMEMQQDLGELVAQGQYGVGVGTRVTVTWTPADRNGKPVARCEVFTGTIILCRCPNPISGLEVIVETVTRTGRKDVRSFFPGGREYTFTIVDSPEN